MFDNPKELLDKIRLGEITFLECFDEVRIATVAGGLILSFID